MKKIIIVLFFFTSYICYGQKSTKQTIVFFDSLDFYFNYDALSHIPCHKVPGGVYAVWVKFDKKGIMQEMQFSHDSLDYLKSLFFETIKSSIKSLAYKSKKNYSNKQFCQMFFFNNLSCHGFLNNTTLFNENVKDSIDSKDIYIEISSMLSLQLQSIDSSVKNFKFPKGFEREKTILLLPVLIGNFHPEMKKPPRGFQNDVRKARDGDIPQNLKEEIEKGVEKRKAEKSNK